MQLPPLRRTLDEECLGDFSRVTDDLTANLWTWCPRSSWGCQCCCCRHPQHLADEAVVWCRGNAVTDLPTEVTFWCSWCSRAHEAPGCFPPVAVVAAAVPAAGSGS